MKSDFRSESFQIKIQHNSFCQQFDDWMLQKNKENDPKRAFEQRSKETQIKIKP